MPSRTLSFGAAALVAVVALQQLACAAALSPAEQRIVDKWVPLTSDAVKAAYRSEREHLKKQPTRFFHAKTHMGLHAHFVGMDSAEGPGSAGIFKAGNRFPAVVRLSSGDPTIKKDSEKDLKGFALKVNAKGHESERNRLPMVNHEMVRGLFTHNTNGDDAGDEHSQDFIAATGEAHFFRKVQDEARLVTNSAKGIVARNGESRVDQALLFLGKIVDFVRGASLALVKNLKAAQKDGTVHNIFEVPAYHSQTPYEYRGKLVRYKFEPFLEYENPGPFQPFLVPASEHMRQFREDQLYEVRYNTYDTLYATEPSKKLKRAGFKVYVRYPPAGVDPNNAQLVWEQAVAKQVGVVELDLEQDPIKDSDVESLSFNPWRGFVEHKPLGAINALRRDLYKQASNVRVEGKFYCPFATGALGQADLARPRPTGKAPGLSAILGATPKAGNANRELAAHAGLPLAGGKPGLSALIGSAPKAGSAKQTVPMDRPVVVEADVTH